MTDELSIHQAPQRRRRHSHPRTWIGLGAAALLILLSAGMLALLRPMFNTAQPDTIELQAVSPNGGANGQFTIRLRLSRADGQPLSPSITTTADLLDAHSGEPLLGRQCGFQVNRRAGLRWIDVTLLGPRPPGLNAPRRVRASVGVQAMPPKAVLAMLLWNFRGRSLPQPSFTGTHGRRLYQDLVLPPPPALPPDRKSGPSAP